MTTELSSCPSHISSCGGHTKSRPSSSPKSLVVTQHADHNDDIITAPLVGPTHHRPIAQHPSRGWWRTDVMLPVSCHRHLHLAALLCRPAPLASRTRRVSFPWPSRLRQNLPTSPQHVDEPRHRAARRQPALFRTRSPLRSRSAWGSASGYAAQCFPARWA